MTEGFGMERMRRRGRGETERGYGADRRGRWTVQGGKEALGRNWRMQRWMEPKDGYWRCTYLLLRIRNDGRRHEQARGRANLDPIGKPVRTKIVGERSPEALD